LICPRWFLALPLAMVALSPLAAHDEVNLPHVVPSHEHDAEAAVAFGGPTVSEGVGPIQLLASLDVGREFAGIDGRRLRARIITLQPGAVVAVHEHRQRPGIAYILEGVVVEQRSDHDEPQIRGPGAVAVEYSGLAHWWRNDGDVVVRALVVDIVEEE
jgi:quercetin dioxygenase-like cupin family protein